MTPRTLDLNFEAQLRRHRLLTHDEELDLMEQGISLNEHYSLSPDRYILPPLNFVPCRWIERYDLTVMYGAHSLGSAERALLTQRFNDGALLPQAVATGEYHELHKPRADSVMTATVPDIKPRVEVLPEPVPPNVKRSIEEADPDFGIQAPMNQQVKAKPKVNLVDLDYDSEDEIPLQQKTKRKVVADDDDIEDEIPLKRRRKDTQPQAPAPTAPKLKLKFKAPPPPPLTARPRAAGSASSTPRKRTLIANQSKDDDSDDEYQPLTRSANSTPRPNVYANTSLPYTTPTAPTSQPTRTPTITSSGRSISPPPLRQLPNVSFKPGTRKIPANIKQIVAAVGKVKIGKEGLPQRTGLRNTVGFTGRDGVLKTSSELWDWYGDTRLFSEKEWKYFASNEEGRRKRNGGLR